MAADREGADGPYLRRFLVMLIFWLTVLFTSLGLLAPRNVTTVACLFAAPCR